MPLCRQFHFNLIGFTALDDFDAISLDFAAVHPDMRSGSPSYPGISHHEFRAAETANRTGSRPVFWQLRFDQQTCRAAFQTEQALDQ